MWPRGLRPRRWCRPGGPRTGGGRRRPQVDQVGRSATGGGRRAGRRRPPGTPGRRCGRSGSRPRRRRRARGQVGPLELGGVVAPAGGDGRVHGRGGAAAGLGGEGGGGRVQPGGMGAGRPTGRGQLGRGVAVEEGGVGLPGQERLRAQHPDEQVAVADDPVDAGGGQGRGQHPGRLRPGRGVGDDLGQQRVVVHPHRRRTRRPPRRPPRPRHPGTGRNRCSTPPGAGTRRTGPRRRGGPRWRGRAARRRTPPGEGLAGGDQELEPDQVEAGDGLGDRVLDLDAGVDLEEPEPSPWTRNSTVPAPT